MVRKLKVIVSVTILASIISSCGRIDENLNGTAKMGVETTPPDISVSSPFVTEPPKNSSEQESQVETIVPTPTQPLKTYIEADEILPLIAEGSQESGKKITEMYPSGLSVDYTYTNKIRYVKIDGNLMVEGVHLGLSPNDIVSISRNVQIFEIGASGFGYLESLIIHFNGLNGPKYAILVSYEDYTLVALSKSKEEPISLLAVYRKIKPDDIAEVFLSYADLKAFPESLSIENIVPVKQEGWEAYRFNLVKETKTRGTVVLETFCIMQYLYSIYEIEDDRLYFIGDYPHDITHFNCMEKDMQLIQYNSRDIALSELFDVSLLNSSLCLTVKKTGANIYIPIPKRLFDNLNIYSDFMDYQNLLIVESLPGEDPTHQIFRLRCLAGWDGGFRGRDLDSINIYYDVGKLEIEFDEESGEVISLVVKPQYSIEQASAKKVIVIDDLKIGPFYIEMDTVDLRQIAEREKNVKDRIIISEDDFTIGKGEYEPSVLLLNTHSLASCLNHFLYSGTLYKTPKGIGIGSTKEDVINAYGPADIGYYEKDVWTYLVSIPESELTYGQRYLSSLDNGRMVLTFSEGSLISISCNYLYGYE